MPNKHRLIYVAILSALATACSTGSNLNTGNHHPTTNIPSTDGKDNTGNTGGNNNTGNTGSNDNTGNTGGNDNTGNTGGNEPAKTNFDTISDSEVQKANSSIDDGKTEEPAPEPEFGYSIASPFTGGKTYDGLTDEQKETNASINTAVAKTNSNADDYNTLTFINSPEEQKEGATKQVTITKDGFSSNTYSETDTKEYYPLKGDTHEDIKDNMVLVIESDVPYTSLKMVEFDHTKAGAVFDGGNENGTQYANIFYRGKDVSELLPSGGTAMYNGSWEVVRKVEPTASGANAGYGVGADLNKRAVAEFTVDFSDKSITGDLKKTEAQGEAFAYTLDGKINGNTFTANATSTPDATNKDKAKVTGGFFGKQGAELAGKLLSEKAAGVFAAKQTSNEGLVEGKEQPKTIYNQAKAITADSKADNIFATDFTEVLAGTEKLPNIDKITINGVEIDLLNEVKKSPSSVFGNENSLPLQFTRIGEVVDKNKQSSFFYQGQLTQTMPTTGKATYEGNWIGYGKSEKGTQFSMKKDLDAKINFTADFAKKALTGKFLSPAGVDAMTLNDVKITGNTFAGKANIEGRGLVNDKDGVQDRIKGTVNVSGGFFGDKANELGGQFSKDDKNFAGVFAGKKVADK